MNEKKMANEVFLLFMLFSLVDLGDENDRNLKLPSQIAAENAAAGGMETVESAEKTATKMAEQAGETNAKVNQSISNEFFHHDRRISLV